MPFCITGTMQSLEIISKSLEENQDNDEFVLFDLRTL